MNWQSKTFHQLTLEELFAILKLRSEVFVVEQDCVYQDPDDTDLHSHHLMATADGRLVAYLRVIPAGVESGNEGSIGRLLIAKEHRGKGLGHELIDRGIQLYKEVVGREHPCVIHAQSHLEKFYQGHGFKTISQPFMFEGLMHTIMKLEP